MTGTSTSPATTLASAPSMPATATTTRAPRMMSIWSNRRCMPATPTSAINMTRLPKNVAVSTASSATGRSAVPAVTIAMYESVGGGGDCTTDIVRARPLYVAAAKRDFTASNTSCEARVARTFEPCSCSMLTISSISPVRLPSQYTTSGAPVRRSRPISTFVCPTSTYPALHSSAVAPSMSRSPLRTRSNISLMDSFFIFTNP